MIAEAAASANLLKGQRAVPSRILLTEGDYAMLKDLAERHGISASFLASRLVSYIVRTEGAAVLSAPVVGRHGEQK